MRTTPLFLITGLILLTGCALDPNLPPPGLDHPAHPEAVTAPLPPPSTTLEVTALPPSRPADAPAASQGGGPAPDMPHHHH